MARLWFVTPVMQPNKRVAGPFETLADCEKACVLHADRTVAVQHLTEGRLPMGFVPHQFDVEIGAAHYMAPASTSTAPVPARAARPVGHLPAVCYTYTLSALRVLCLALGLDSAPRSLDRRATIEHIEAQLAKLGRKGGET